MCSLLGIVLVLVFDFHNDTGVLFRFVLKFTSIAYFTMKQRKKKLNLVIELVSKLLVTF